MKYSFLAAIFTGLTLVSQAATASSSNCFCSQLENTIIDNNHLISLNPNDASAYYNRGLSYAEQGDYQNALSDCQQAADLYQQQGNTEGYQDAMYYLCY